MTEAKELVDRLIQRINEHPTAIEHDPNWRYDREGLKRSYDLIEQLLVRLVAYRNQITPEMQERICVSLGDDAKSSILLLVEEIVDRERFLRLIKPYPSHRYDLWRSLLEFSDKAWDADRAKAIWDLYECKHWYLEKVITGCYMIVSYPSLKNRTASSYIDYLRQMISMCPQVVDHDDNALLCNLLSIRSKKIPEVLTWYLATYPVIWVGQPRIPSSIRYTAPVAKILMEHTLEYRVIQMNARIFYLYDDPTGQVMLVSESKFPADDDWDLSNHLQFSIDGWYVYSDQIYLCDQTSQFCQREDEWCDLPAMTEETGELIKYNQEDLETTVIARIPQILADALPRIRSRQKSARSAAS